MYLEKCTIRNIKCFEDVTLDFRQSDGSIRLWNVLIGENGTGKSTLLQAIAIALAGQKAASVLLPRPRGWVRAGAQRGEIETTSLYTQSDLTTLDVQPEGLEAGQLFHHNNPVEANYAIIEGIETSIDNRRFDGPTVVALAGPDKNKIDDFNFPMDRFAVGYGPFRRMSDGSEQANKIIESGARESRFITLFREDAALSHCEEWLMNLDYARLDSSDSQFQRYSSLLLEVIRETLDTYLLPKEIGLSTINSQGVFFRTPYADKVRMSELSDGYRAILALSIDLLRHLSLSYSDMLQFFPSSWLRQVSGVVLIDELDAHLHPTWQREIGSWLKDRFPRMQFIVATHSPFITQVADDNGLYILRPSESQPNTVQAYVDETSVRGWRADQILSILFDTPSVYDPETEGRLREYGRLKILSEMGRLPEDQAQTFAELQAWVEKYLAPPGDTRDEMQHYRDVKRRGQELSRMLRERRTDDKG
jgi:predicted ATPase